MMLVRNLICAALAGWCVLASLVPAGLPARCVSDVNGDSECNVLDIQCVLAGMLAAADAMERADVNRDGTVDLLDLQQVVAAAAGQPAQAGPADEQPFQQNAVVHAGFDVPQAERSHIITASQVQNLAPSRPTFSSTRAAEFRPLPEAERYLFLLTPNAPPMHA